MAEFENTNNRIEVEKWYSITDVPAIEDRNHKGKMYMPVSAKFTFVDGECTNLILNGKIIKVNGEFGERVTVIPGVYTWDKSNWSEWLHELLAKVYSDLRSMHVLA